jgi:hypothetical protein
MSDAAWEHIMSGDVGIFWVDQGQLIMAAVPLTDGIDDGQFVNEPDDHEPYWATVQRSHVHLWDVEYFHVPRGRVLLNKSKHRYYVYLTRSCAPTPLNG